VSGYPSDGEAANVSKETTKKELLSVEGVEKEDFMLQNINIIMGSVNALEYGETMYKLPSLINVEDYLEKNNLIAA